MNGHATSRYDSLSSGALRAFAAAGLLVAAALTAPASSTRSPHSSGAPKPPSTLAQTPAPTPVKPRIADEVEGEDKNGAEKENGQKPAEPAKTGNRRRGRQNAPTPTPSAIDVTFTTDVPEAEIFLNLGGTRTQSLGKTGADGKLTTRLARGTHNIIASRAGQSIQRQQIKVRPGNTTFAFSLALPATPPNPEKEAKEAATTEPAGGGAATVAEASAGERATAAADEVLKRYLDAKESEGLSATDWQTVQSQLNAAAEKEPDDRQLRGRSLFAEGQLAYLRGDYPSALVAFNKLVLEMPEMVAAHYARGNAYLVTNQPAEAVKAYRRAIELDPQLALGYKGLGDALTKQGKSKEAQQYYQRYKNFGGTPASDASFSTARTLKKQRRWAQALKEFEDIAASQPSADVYIDIGDCYVELEKPLSASQAYRKAAELDPKSAIAHYRYGEVMYGLREYAAAMESFERALALDLTGASINRRRAREMADKAAEKLRKM